jgi:DNA-binding CsgD family transcriptional regulator
MTCHSEEKEMKVRAAAVLIASGWTYKDAAKAVGADPNNLTAFTGLAARRASAEGRTARMAAMYREGKTLAEIGLEFNLTRERVRQLLKASGMSAHMGGATKKKESKAVARAERRIKTRNATTMRSHGCDYQTASDLNGGEGLLTYGTKSHLYWRQRRSAKNRRIEWNMTFPEWCQIWADSGKWELRGRGRGRYCMARIADSGAYEVGNVRIITTEENIREGYVTTPSAERQKVNVHLSLIREKQDRALELSLAGKTNKEIALEMGISPPYVRQLLVVARKREPALQVAA